MAITVRASDLYYRYRKDTVNRHQPKFSGKPDKSTFNRDDLYEVLPMLAKVMEELGSNDQRILHCVEEIMIRQLPRFIQSREEVFEFLVGSTRETVGWE